MSSSLGLCEGASADCRPPPRWLQPALVYVPFDPSSFMLIDESDTRTTASAMKELERRFVRVCSSNGICDMSSSPNSYSTRRRWRSDAPIDHHEGFFGGARRLCFVGAGARVIRSGEDGRVESS
jgi:hypothetical protein